MRKGGYSPWNKFEPKGEAISPFLGCGYCIFLVRLDLNKAFTVCLLGVDRNSKKCEQCERSNKQALQTAKFLWAAQTDKYGTILNCIKLMKLHAISLIHMQLFGQAWIHGVRKTLNLQQIQTFWSQNPMSSAYSYNCQWKNNNRTPKSNSKLPFNNKT